MRPIDWRNGKVRFIDQTQLPTEEIYIETDKVEVLAEAIRSLQIRGAPALGIAAAFGLVLGARTFSGTDRNEFLRHCKKISSYIGSTRPTAVNLFWALGRMQSAVNGNTSPEIGDLQNCLLNEALLIQRQEIETCRLIGQHGSDIIPDGGGILTHCNTGALATGDYGTALSAIIRAHELGKKILVYVDETRPLFQGARLTTWELRNHGIEAVLITDNAAGFVMQQGKIDVVIVGADRVVANGDVANKIGTYTIAVLAEKHRIPFYVAAPSSTFDPTLLSGKEIPIEERDSREVTELFGHRIAPPGIAVYAPAFDVTPHELVKGIITEYGILRPPYSASIEALLSERPNSVGRR
jgi:methylthioribose-1-phosphate isomerase